MDRQHWLRRVERLQDPPPTLRELSDNLLERVNASLPEGGRIAQQHLNRVGLAIEAWLEERRIR